MRTSTSVAKKLLGLWLHLARKLERLPEEARLELD
jgi:hypothetical protein